jgi:molybdopterin synthase catalytic subunit
MAEMDSDWVELTAEPIDAARAFQFVGDPVAGGVAIFAGLTRAETSTDGQTLAALDYEAYGEMAVAQMRELARRARQKWPIVRQAILHRTGRVALAEPSVVIAVACPHRGQAFDACRWIIDTLKAEVAIWKKEIWAGGAERWVHPSTEETRGRGDAGTGGSEQ